MNILWIKIRNIAVPIVGAAVTFYVVAIPLSFLPSPANVVTTPVGILAGLLTLRYLRSLLEEKN